ncbi:MAG TPA: DUF167 domain-containing protein [Actinomycetota bacterium]|nr:DUF167 domain-containing protein [Actinomycetota bacterium]
MPLPPYLRPSRDGTILDAFVQPGAAKDAVGGVHGDALRVKVTAPPVDGKANRAVEELVARLAGIRRADVEVVSGHGSRHKRIALRGIPPEDVATRLGVVLSSRAHEPG